MIQNVFLPEKIGDYFVFKQRIVGIDITKTHIHASLVIASGNSVSINKYVSESLNGEQQTHEERVIATLPKVMAALGTAHRIHTALPSSVVVFKELRLPFMTHDKIEMVINFEVEPLLPFPAKDALIDFIITSINKEEKSAQVLVAVVQKRHLLEHLSLFEQAGCNPDIVTVDMFALYGLYSQIPSYQLLSGSVALIDMSMNTTSIVIVQTNQLRIVRTLPYGMAFVAKNAGTSADLKPQQIMDHLIRFGSEKGSDSAMNQSIKNSLAEFFNKVQFALSSTMNQLQSSKPEKIILCGPGAEIKNIASFAQEHLSAQCEIFDIKKLTENKRYYIAPNVTLSQPALLSVAYAIPVPILDKFNFRTGEFAPAQETLLIKQIIVAAVLVICLFGSLIAHTIMQSRKLNAEITASQEEAVKALKERFKGIDEDEDDLDDVLETAKAELAKEEIIWRAFSSKNRTSFLEYLLELTSRINKQELGFQPKQISIRDGAPDEIIIRAEVKGFEELNKLEEALKQSKLFEYVDSPAKPDFTMKILSKKI